MFIYVIVCSESLKIYVGQHKGTNLGKYLSKKFYEAHQYSGLRSRLYAALRKYSRNSWSIHPLASDVQTRAELDDLERHYIRVLKTQHPEVGYNICRGGEGHPGPFSEDSKHRMSEMMQNRWDSGWEGGMTGKTHSSESKQQMSEAASQRTGEKNPFFGRHHSDATKQKNAEAHRKPWSPERHVALKPLTDERRKQRSESGKLGGAPLGNTHGQGNKGRVFSDETKLRMKQAASLRWANPAERLQQSARLKK